ncbi:MAG: metallophosphoesterase [Planctomycetaceae bacterium]
MGEWFYAGGFINRTTPVIATPGNHEYFKEEGENGEYKTYHLTDHWRPTFTFPEHGPSELEESVYFIDYQDVRIISMNSNERLDEQALWLEKVLSDNPNHWTILTFHHPVYSLKRVVTTRPFVKSGNLSSINLKSTWFCRDMTILIPEPS